MKSPKTTILSSTSLRQVVFLNQKPVFEQWMARLIVKNRHHKDMCYNEIDHFTINIILGLDTNIVVGRGIVNTWREKETNSSLWPPISFAFELQFQDLKWWFTLFTVTTYSHEMIPDSIQQSSFIYGVGKCHNEATYLKCHEYVCVSSLNTYNHGEGTYQL